MSKKVRCYHTTREVIDTTKNEKHTILVYGELVQTNDTKGFILAPVTYTKRNHKDIKSIDDKYVVLSRNQDLRPTRQFNFGWAICSADDEFDLEVGIRIAKRRFSDSPMTTTDVRFFSDDMIHSILENEVNFIEKNLETKYLPDDHQNGCNGECKSCQRHDCYKKGNIDPEIKTYDESKEPEVELETEEFPTVEFEARKGQRQLKHGDFVKFTDGYAFMYGVVRDTGVTDNSKSPYINLYWKLTKVQDGWTFRTNETINRNDVEFLTPREYEDSLTYKILYEVFGVVWDGKRNSIKLKSF